MQKLLPIACLILLCCTGCGNRNAESGYDLDQSDPMAVVQAIFDVAGGASAAVLGKLCDPKGENDQDTRRICDQATADALDDEFIQYFRNGKIDGEALLQGEKASVPFLFGPRGDKSDTMEMIRRDGKWYLYQF